MRARVTAVAVLLCMLVTAVGVRGQSTPTVGSLEELMSARAFESAGLRKLSPEELSALNTWLRAYAKLFVQPPVQTVPAPISAPSTPEIIESQIDDQFTGWEGETIFKLRNGQIWQQSSYAYTYHYAYAPRVLIYRSGGVYKMKVDGVRSEISVRRLK